MSYCRWNYDCDVYVYEHVDGGWVTEVNAPRSVRDQLYFRDDTPDKCVDRLEGLRAKGYQVPQFAIDSLRDEKAWRRRRGLQNQNDVAAKSVWLDSIKWTPAWWIRFRLWRGRKKLAKIMGQGLRDHMERSALRSGFVRRVLEPFAKKGE